MSRVEPRPRDAVRIFQEAFGTAPGQVWTAPGRVNLLGEHTDYNGGLCLPVALGFGVDCAAGVTATGRLRVASAQRPGEVVDLDLRQLKPGNGWADYVVGVVQVLQPEVTGLDLAVDSDVPEGAGLSSSAALECAALSAVSGLLGLDLAPMQVAQLAQRAENAFVGVPCGLMDQAISALGTAGHALLFDARAFEVRQVPFDVVPLELLVLDTVAHHQLVDGGYASRRAQCDQAADLLGVSCLREATSLSRLSGLLLQRARHVVTEIDRVEQAVVLLDAGSLDGLGELMTASHVSLRDDFEVTVPALDVAVEVALAAGAPGARMTGGGFGGSIVALAHDGAQVAAAVERAFAERGWREPRWFVATASQGAHRLR